MLTIISLLESTASQNEPIMGRLREVEVSNQLVFLLPIFLSSDLHVALLVDLAESVSQRLL